MDRPDAELVGRCLAGEHEAWESIVHQGLLRLSADLREAVILRDLEGFTYEEMARTLDVRIGTVKSRISRGRTELARVLSGSSSLARDQL